MQFIAKRKEKLSKKSTNVPRCFSYNTSLFKSQFYLKNVDSGIDDINMSILHVMAPKSMAIKAYPGDETI